MRQQDGKRSSFASSVFCRMAKRVLPVMLAAFSGIGTLAAATIQYEVAELGTPGAYRYTYTVSGRLDKNQEIDIRFDPAIYTNLRNGVAGSDFDVLLFQPNNPPGAFGDFSALALVDNPLLLPFLVDVTYLGVGLPGPQLFFINTYQTLSTGEAGNFIGSEMGVTTPVGGGSGIPEPGTFSISAIGAAVGGACYFRRRRRLTDSAN